MEVQITREHQDLVYRMLVQDSIACFQFAIGCYSSSRTQPRRCGKGTSLLHGFPTFRELIVSSFTLPISNDKDGPPEAFQSET